MRFYALISERAVNMEFWDILDRDGNITGKTPVLGTVTLEKGKYHLVVHIWIKNSKGEFLIQQRSDQMDMMPGVWAVTGGSAKSGETSVQAAVRELSEELGIFVSPKQFRFHKRLLRRNSIADIWFLDYDVEIRSLKLQKEEVTQAKWVSSDELRFMIAQGAFHDYGKAYFKEIF